MPGQSIPLWPVPLILPADVDRLLIDKELQPSLAILGQAGAGLLDATEGHGRLLVAGVDVHMGETRFDAVDILLGVGEVLREDR